MSSFQIYTYNFNIFYFERLKLVVLMLCNLDCYVNLVICIVNPLFILSYGSHRITMQYFTRIYIDVNIKYVSIGHIIHFLRSKYGPKTMKILWFLPIQYSLSNRITPPVSMLLVLGVLPC